MNATIKATTTTTITSPIIVEVEFEVSGVCAATVKASAEAERVPASEAIAFLIVSHVNDCFWALKSFGATLYLPKSKYIWAQQHEE